MKMGYTPTAIFALTAMLSLLGCARGDGKPSAMAAPVDKNPSVAAAPATTGPALAEQDMPIRGEIKETYQLSPGAQVDISGVEGPVEVETTDAGPTHLYLLRTARTQRDYDCDKIDIQHTSDKLVVRRHQDKQCGVIHAREQMKLTVPRSAHLSFAEIEGDLTIGVTDGVLRLNSVEGFVKVAQAPSAEIKSLEKGLSLNVSNLDARGITISRVEGSVELGLAGEVNADLRITAYSGEIKTDLPGAEVSDSGREGYRARIGSGGANISLSGIEGNIRIRRV